MTSSVFNKRLRKNELQRYSFFLKMQSLFEKLFFFQNKFSLKRLIKEFLSAHLLNISIKNGNL